MIKQMEEEEEDLPIISNQGNSLAMNKIHCIIQGLHTHMHMDTAWLANDTEGIDYPKETTMTTLDHNNYWSAPCCKPKR